MSHRKGFTLIELLVVMSLIGVIAAMSIPSYAAMQQRSVLKSTTDEVVSLIRTAQNEALTSLGGTNHGVRFETNRVVIFSPAGDEQSLTTCPGCTFSPLPVSVTFAKLTGSPGSPTQVDLNSGGNHKTIAISNVGQITVN